MKLDKLITLRGKLKKSDQLLRITKIIENFDLAKSAYEIFKEYRNMWVKDMKEEYELKSIAALQCLYLCGRVCLYITEGINKQIKTQEINPIRTNYKEWVKKFIDFRNDFGSHSLNEKNKYYSEIAMFGNLVPNLKVENHYIDSLKIAKSYEVNPTEDINNLFNYLEELADIYEKQWARI
jgi:hypothetical protein